MRKKELQENKPIGYMYIPQVWPITRGPVIIVKFKEISTTIDSINNVPLK
jgi:hypothetical protein